MTFSTLAFCLPWPDMITSLDIDQYIYRGKTSVWLSASICATAGATWDPIIFTGYGRESYNSDRFSKQLLFCFYQLNIAIWLIFRLPMAGNKTSFLIYAVWATFDGVPLTWMRPETKPHLKHLFRNLATTKQILPITFWKYKTFQFFFLSLFFTNTFSLAVNTCKVRLVLFVWNAQ